MHPSFCLTALSGPSHVAPCQPKGGSRNALPRLLVTLLALLPLSLQADPFDQAKQIHDRLTGVPPDQVTVTAMAERIQDGVTDPMVIAEEALAHPDFYRVTLKNFATPWTNRDMSVFAPLNDYTATVIGVVRDDLDFRRILYDDILYVGAAGGPAYSATSNAHYADLEQRAIDLSNDVLLIRTTQSSQPGGLPQAATAGVMTTRAAAQAFFYLGTNRAMLRFTLLNHLCHDLEELQDGTRPADRIRQDVSRSPGGDSRVFLNNCVTCHAGMDPLAQAFAYYDFYQVNGGEIDPDGAGASIRYNDLGQTDPRNGNRVRPKYLINANTFPHGFITADDRWDNYWRNGPNAHLGWDPSLPGTGYGAKSLGEELANSRAFASCQVTKVFRSQCLRDPVAEGDRDQLALMTDQFQNNGYDLKQIFAEAAYFCATQ